MSTEAVMKHGSKKLKDELIKGTVNKMVNEFHSFDAEKQEEIVIKLVESRNEAKEHLLAIQEHHDMFQDALSVIDEYYGEDTELKHDL